MRLCPFRSQSFKSSSQSLFHGFGLFTSTLLKKRIISLLVLKTVHPVFNKIVIMYSIIFLSAAPDADTLASHPNDFNRFLPITITHATILGSEKR